MKRFLLTGANGFLGSQVVESSKSVANVEIIPTSRDGFNDSIACDLMSINDVKEIVRDTRPDKIIHTAAFVPKTRSEYKSSSLNKNNSIILSNIQRSSTVPIIYTSSMTVYGYSEKTNRCESDFCHPISEYGKSKLGCEDLLKTANCASVALRLPGLYGLNRKKGIIHNVMAALVARNKFDLPNEKILWAAMDVSDAASVIINIASSYEGEKFSKINVGYKDVYSINRLISILEDIFHEHIPYDVEHPEISFNLKELDKYNSLPPCLSLKSSLIKMKANYEKKT